MKRIHRSAIVPYSCRQMFDIVNDVERYPDFLPWCSDANIVSESDSEMLARLEMSATGMRYNFTTRNQLDAPAAIRMSLVDGMFSSLSGGWQFLALGEDGSKVSLELRFSLPGSLMRMSAGRVFTSAADKMVDAFCRRAEQLHG